MKFLVLLLSARWVLSTPLPEPMMGSAQILSEAIDLTHTTANGTAIQWPTASRFEFKIGFRGWKDFEDGDRLYYEGNDFQQERKKLAGIF